MAKNMTMKKALKKVEGSKADLKMDKKLAKTMMHKTSVRSAAQKAMGGKY